MPRHTTETSFKSQGKLKTQKCKECNSDFKIFESDILRGRKYCSKKCSKSHQGIKGDNHWKKQIAKENQMEISCKTCGTDFKFQNYKNRIFCSRSCSSLAQDHTRFRGQNNYNWKGGITPLLKSIRSSTQYASWREMVFIRDDYTCQKCNAKEELHAHHIIHLADDLSKAFLLENGITLCIECHQKEHPELKLTLIKKEVE